MDVLSGISVFGPHAYAGDLKIVIGPEGEDPQSKISLAAIRLKESDDDSCLWWLRCEDEQLRNIIKATLR